VSEDAEAGYQFLNDDDPHYTAIGLVASHWALLEAAIDGAIAFLANTDERSMACVTAQLIGPAKRMDALIALFLFSGGSDALKRELKSFQGSIQKLGEDRNRIVHDPLMKGKITGKVYKSLATAKGQLQYDFVPISIESYKHTATLISDAITKFLELRTKIDREIHELLQAQLKRIGAIPQDQNPPDENS